VTSLQVSRINLRKLQHKMAELDEYINLTLDQLFNDDSKQESDWKALLIDSEFSPMHKLAIAMQDSKLDLQTTKEDDLHSNLHQNALLNLILGSLIPELAFPAFALTHSILKPLICLLEHEAKRKQAFKISHFVEKVPKWEDWDEDYVEPPPPSPGGENREEIILDLLIQILTYCPSAQLQYEVELKPLYEQMFKIVEEHFATREQTAIRNKVMRVLCLLNYSLLHSTKASISEDLKLLLVDMMYNFEDAASKLGENIGGLILREFNEAATTDADTEEALLHLITQIHVANSGEYMFLIDSNDFGVLFDVILRRLQRTEPSDPVKPLFVIILSHILQIHFQIALSYLQALQMCLDRDANHHQRRFKNFDGEILETLKLIINSEETMQETKNMAFQVLKHDSLL
jgi:hypothetical protein